MSDSVPWLSVILLGAYHGINPAMGWLFAMARGLQERSRKALLLALVPIAVGHLASVALVIVIVGLAQVVITSDTLRVAGGTIVIALGIYKLVKPRSHPRWVGMRIGLAELGLWSFTMSTAHGAGLMLLPVLFRTSHAAAHVHMSGAHNAAMAGVHAVSIAGGTWATVHTLTMFVTMAAVSLIVFERLGIGVLRHAWVNLDRVWAAVIVVSGIFTLVGI